MTALTKAALDRVLQLKHLRDDAGALAESTQNRMSQLRRALMNSPPGAASIEFELSRLQGSFSDHRMHLDNLTQLLAQIASWQETLKSDVVLVDAKRIRVELRDGETVVAALVSTRQRVAELDAEMKKVRNSSPTVDEQKAAVVSFISDLVKKSRPKIKASRHGQFSVDFSDPSSQTPRVDVMAYLAWLDRDALTNRLCSEIDELPPADLVLSAEQKDAVIRKLREDKLTLEREEAALLEKGEMEGQRLLFRPFISPLALLNLAMTTKESSAVAA